MGLYIIRLRFAGSVSASATTRAWGATIQGPTTVTLLGGAATTSTVITRGVGATTQQQQAQELQEESIKWSLFMGVPDI